MREKNSLKFGLLILSAFLAAGAGAFAGQQPGGQDPGPQMGRRSGRNIVEMRLDRMTRVLGLSPAQREEIRPILRRESERMREVFRNSSRSQESRRARFREIRKKTMRKIRPLLTREQRPKLREAMAPPRRYRRG